MENKLRELRITAGLSQPRIANAAGLSVRTISKVERGRAVAPTTRAKIFNGYNRLAKNDGFKQVSYETMFPKDNLLS
jgi:transcriptional regulator with XRE-family HTH domain